MRLSEMLTNRALPKAIGNFNEGRGYCALGTVLYNLGRKDLAKKNAYSSYRFLMRVFPILKTKVENPETKFTNILSNVIISLNDDALWSRSMIARFVRKLEDKLNSKLVYRAIKNVNKTKSMGLVTA